MNEKLWTKKYLISLLLVFGVNMGYALLNSVMAIYGTVLTSSSVIGGYMITAFTIAALVARVFIKKLNEKFNNKTLLISGLVLTVIAAAGYCKAGEIISFILFRILHGFGFGISLTCATAISNEYVPASRLSEGVGFTSSANTIANAISPTIALQILGQDYSNFLTLFIVLFVISMTILTLSFLLKNNNQLATANKKQQSYRGIIIASVFFLGTLSQGAVNSFLTSFARILDLGNIGLFFTITAIVTFFSRFFSRKVQNWLGIRKLSLILTLVLAVSIFSIALVQTKLQLYLLAIPYGLASGLLFPIFNFRIIQTVLPSQFAFATSIYYCGVDIGYGVGAVVWGYVGQYLGYQAIFYLAAITLIIMLLADQFIYQKFKI